jgi:phosphoglycerate dehydrogenase-like enzyme
MLGVRATPVNEAKASPAGPLIGGRPRRLHTAMPTVIVLDDYQDIALTSADWSAVRERHPVLALSTRISGEADLVRALSGSVAIVAMRERTPLPARVLEQLPDLRLIVTTGMRNDAIDMVAAARLGITVCGTTSSSHAVAELTIGMMIALARTFVGEDAAVRSGGWQHTIGPQLYGRTLGIVGLGRIGTLVAGIARALGMTLIAWSPNLTEARAAHHGARAAAKEELFRSADIVTIHLPLSPDSRGLVGAREFAWMKPTAYLINTSRGPIVDEPALLAALKNGRIAGAGLDVYDVEPLPVDHPLRSSRNTLLLPHLGYVTTDTYRRWYGEAVEDILAWRSGNPIRVLAQPRRGRAM